MLALFSRLPISLKLILINVMVVAVALFIASIAYVVNETYVGRERIVQRLVGQAELLAYNSVASLISKDTATAANILASLKSNPDVDRAMVFDSEGILFAQYVSELLTNEEREERGSPYVFAKKLIWPSNQQDNIIFSDATVYLIKSIVVSGSASSVFAASDDTMGSLYFQANLDEFIAYRSRLVSIILGVVFVSLGVSVLIMLRAQKLISDPILHLSKAIKQVTNEGNYTVRASILAQDELGLLTDGFNGMLSEIERRDEELSRHKEKLEHEVEKRTAALRTSNSELESTVIALKQANRAIRISEENKRIAEGSAKAKSQFLANMSHELRTPMNGVLGMLALVQETELATEQEYYINMAVESGKTLMVFLNDVMDLSRIENGKLDVEYIEFDIRTSVEEVFGLLGESCYQKDIELVFIRENCLPSSVVGDPGRFRQVLFNIIGNAIKFTSNGSIQVISRVIDSNDRSVKVHFEVRDTGIGIKRDSLAVIFENFSQADSSTTREFGGTGLGLALCRRLVNLMGGDIGVESEYGIGSAFWFDLVFKKSILVEESRPSTISISRVLVLEDRTASRHSLIQYLADLEIAVTCVEEWGDFWGEFDRIQCSDQQFDAIALSVNLGEVDYVDILQVLGYNEQLKQVPVILMGSWQQRKEVAEKNKGDLDQFLVKPFRRQAVTTMLERASSNVVVRETMAENKDDNASKSNVLGQILVVEDNKVNQQVAKGRLNRLRYSVDIAENGVKALEALKVKRYDLIFMDCQMPVLDGYDTTRRIREQEVGTLFHVPIVAMTANAMEGDRQLCLDAGMDDYLAKPVNNKDLQSVLDLWLKE